ncbi:MAG: diadenylate cyclase CdaA [Paludibacteraceae bacterium]|nr:diadenylate cyclase CdaA [Paludibacteraceae bacterium]
MFGIDFQIKYIVDILLVALILYYAFRLLRRSGAVNLFWGIMAFVIVWFLVKFVFQLELTSAMFDRIISVGAIALIVIFQEEIRAFFYRLGSRFSGFKFRRVRAESQTQNDRRAQTIVTACNNMSRSRTGALIVVAGKQDLKEYADTGEKLNAEISARLIENIFFKNTPLHDGALIIVGDRLYSAGCILPVSKNQDIPQHFGLRHRAALGITERSDALAIVVSEETGKISIARSGQIKEVSGDLVLVELSTAFASTD